MKARKYVVAMLAAALAEVRVKAVERNPAAAPAALAAQTDFLI